MLRYIVLTWQPEASAQCAAAKHLRERLGDTPQKWREVFCTTGAAVYCIWSPIDREEFYLLPMNSGIVLGSLFSRESIQTERPVILPNNALESSEGKAIVDSEGRLLIDLYWGNYVAIIVPNNPRATWILKDPTGELPCMYSSYNGVFVFFSYVPDAVELNSLQLTIDLDYLRHRLVTGPLRSQAGIREITELHRGHCAKICAGKLTLQPYWNPLTFAHQPPIEEFDAATIELRRVVLGCASAWASRYPRAIHQLSGGLDSSIVLGALASSHNKPEVTCLTLYVPEGASDERPWARLASRSASCDLIEHPRNSQMSLRPIFQALPSLGVECYSVPMEMGPIQQSLARSKRAPVLFNGNGGDNVFGSHTSAFAVLNYLRRHGATTHAFTVARDLALITDTSVWNVARRTAAALAFRSKRALHVSQEVTRPLLSRDVVASSEQLPYYPHPWFTHLREIPWDIITRLGPLMGSPSFYNPLCHPKFGDPEIVAPLHSQPVIEVGLRIAIELAIQNGKDRAVARNAFQSIIPREILARQWKDRSPMFFEELMYSNLGLNREILLDGVLVRERIIDRRNLEEALSGRPTRSKHYAVELLDCLCAEAWLASWHGVRQRAAA